MTISLLLYRPQCADMGEEEILICPLLLRPLLILFYHLLHISHSESSKG